MATDLPSLDDGSDAGWRPGSDEPEPVLLGPEAVDQLAGMVLTLGVELAAVSCRLRHAERRLEAAGLTGERPDDDDDLDAEVAAEVDALAARLLDNLRSKATHQRPLEALTDGPEDGS